MSVEDPLVNGIPLSSLRVIDLRDELEKRGLSKIGNKSVLTERLKAYICENELQNCDETTAKSKSSTEMSTSSNPIVAAYLARQAEVLEIQKRDAELVMRVSDPQSLVFSKWYLIRAVLHRRRFDSVKDEDTTLRTRMAVGHPLGSSAVMKTKTSKERIRKEQASSDDSYTDKVNEVTSPRRSQRHPRLQSESLDQSMEVVEQTAAGNASEQDSSVEPSMVPKHVEKSAATSAKKSPSSTPNRQKTPDKQTEMDEINDEENEKTVSVNEVHEEDKQSDDESTRYYQKNSDAKQKTPYDELHKTSGCENEVEDSSRSKTSSAAKQMEENGGSGGDHLEELDYGEADAEADADAEDRDAKDELVVEVDEAEDQELNKQRRRLVMALEESREGKNEKRRKVSPSRHPESEIVHIRGLTRPFTDRALKAEITKCGGQIVDFWIDSVKSHCIVQMNSIDEAREVRNAMHNTQWPAANPKTLSVQFDTKENLERHRSGHTPAAVNYPISATRPERKQSERERPTIGHLPGRNPSLKITVEAAMRENEKREESREKERRERARAERETDTRREEEEGKKEKREEKQHNEEKHTTKRDEHDRKRHRSETPPFSRSVTEKRERRDSYGRPESDRDNGRRRDDDKGRHRHHENEKEKEREEKPVKTADSLFMKTKTQPAIYFLPLTDEEVVERQERILAEKKKREHKEQEREKEKEKTRR